MNRSKKKKTMVRNLQLTLWRHIAHDGQLCVAPILANCAKTWTRFAPCQVAQEIVPAHIACDESTV